MKTGRVGGERPDPSLHLDAISRLFAWDKFNDFGTIVIVKISATSPSTRMHRFRRKVEKYLSAALPTELCEQHRVGGKLGSSYLRFEANFRPHASMICPAIPVSY